jgi:hypothetical protein
LFRYFGSTPFLGFGFSFFTFFGFLSGVLSGGAGGADVTGVGAEASGMRSPNFPSTLCPLILSTDLMHRYFFSFFRNFLKRALFF